MVAAGHDSIGPRSRDALNTTTEGKPSTFLVKRGGKPVKAEGVRSRKGMKESWVVLNMNSFL